MHCMSTNLSFTLHRWEEDDRLTFTFFIFHLAHTTACWSPPVQLYSIDKAKNKIKEMTGRRMKKRSIVTRQRICNQSSHTIRFMHLDDWKKEEEFFISLSRINYNRIFIGIRLMCDWKTIEKKKKNMSVNFNNITREIKKMRERSTPFPVTTTKKINFDRHTLSTQGTDSRLLSFAISNNKKNKMNKRAHIWNERN